MAHSPATALRRSPAATVLDYAIPAAILLAVLVVLAPVPPAVVDLLLAANLTVSVLALLGALAARTPLELSIFPTFLLGATLVIAGVIWSQKPPRRRITPHSTSA